MKNYLLFLCLITGYTTNAQFNSGQKIIGGQMNLSITNYDATNSLGLNQKSTFGSVNLSLSKFKSPLRLIGFGIQYSYSDARYNNNNSSSPIENKNNVLGAFLELTKLQPIAKKLYLSFSGMGGINYSINDTYYGNNTRSQTNGYGLYVNGGMGIWYNLTNRFILTGYVSNLFAVNYGFGKSTSYAANNTSVTDGTSNSFSITTGFSSFSLGNFGFGV